MKCARAFPLRVIRAVPWPSLGWTAFAVLAALCFGSPQASAANFFVVLDQQGANDVPAQSDLTQMGRDNSDATFFKLFWSWDSTDVWTGTGQTGDACALFDSDGDGKINYAVCGEISNLNANPADVRETAISPTVWKCSDQKNDRCTQPSPISISGSQVVSGQINTLGSGNLITATDPFDASASNGPGSNYPNDSTLEMDIAKSFLSGSLGNGVLVNVCSYPSIGNGGNNNPFDCIVAPDSGFLVIHKDAGTGVTTPDFNFTVSPVPSGQTNTATISGTGDSKTFGLITGSKTETVTEVNIPADWQAVSGSCRDEDKTADQTSVVFDNSAGTSATLSNISIRSGIKTVCTFVNRLKKGHLVIKKATNPNPDPTDTSFQFSTNFSPSSFSLKNGGSATYDLLPGAYTVTEASATGFSLTNLACVDTGGLGSTYDTTKPTASVNLEAGDTVTCTFTNTEKQKLTIHKRIDTSGDGTGDVDGTGWPFTVKGPSPSTATVCSGNTNSVAKLE